MRPVTLKRTGSCCALVAALVAVAPAVAGASKLPVYALPAGEVATLTSASFNDDACDPLVYGYQVAGENLTRVGHKAAGCTDKVLPDATIGPFSDDTTFRVYLTDTLGPTYVFFSTNPRHAGQTGGGPYRLGIDDSYFGESSPKMEYPGGVTPGSGDLTVTVTIGPGPSRA